MLTVTGVDVSKDELVCCTATGQPRSHNNSPQGVKKLLARCAPGSTIAVEATGRYHRLLAETACAQGLQVFVLNPKDVHKYAESLSPRASNDQIAARIIARFASERKCTPYAILPAFVDTIKDLIRTRSSLVAERTALDNKAREHNNIAAYLKQARDSIKCSISYLDKQIAQVAKQIPQCERLRNIPGFGPLVTPYIAALLASGTFSRSDSFVAFVGLDVKVKESGKFKGRRRLTKRGDPEARRLLYLAAMAACRQPGPFQDMRQRYIDKGKTKIESLVFVARKLARVAWAIYKKGEHYRPERVRNQNESRSKTSAAEPQTQPANQQLAPPIQPPPKKPLSKSSNIINKQKGKKSLDRPT